ncbi:MAG: acyl-CoA dehydrogenase family protein, partial [Pseudomonadota bacterium]
QILGGASYVTGSRVERIYREVRVMAIGGGSEEIMYDLASRQNQF